MLTPFRLYCKLAGAGIEPGTPGLVVQPSNQLRHRGIHLCPGKQILYVRTMWFLVAAPHFLDVHFHHKPKAQNAFMLKSYLMIWCPTLFKQMKMAAKSWNLSF